MPGHVFVLRGDITRLACDAWLVPTGSGMFLEPYWPQQVKPPADQRFGAGALRVLRGERIAGDGRQPWLVNVAWTRRSGEDKREFYTRSVREALREVFASFGPESRPRHNRRFPLVALPLLGGGAGMPMVETGETLRSLLEVVYDERRQASRGVDVALVLRGAAPFAAALKERQAVAPDDWEGLDERLRQRAEALAQQAALGGLALFLGAGIGAGAGLPGWGKLLRALAERAEMDADGVEDLLDDRRNVLDQASYLRRTFGDEERLQHAVATIIGGAGNLYSLSHGLLANLPVREAVTTNYDQLFEAAWEGADPGCPTSVLPHKPQATARRWLLKMHGCVSQHASIVLTRESYIRYGHLYAALEGILQATLLTRHTLFVGFGLRDDNFLRILDAVRRIAGQGGGAEFGAALMMGRDPVTEELYRGDLSWVAFAEQREMQKANRAGTTETQNEKDRPLDYAEAGRKLELFLDYTVSRVGSSSHILAERFETILGEDESQLRAALDPLVALAASPRARSLGWARVRALLAELGAGTSEQDPA